MLKPLHLFRPPGVRGQETCHLGEDRQQRRRRAGTRKQRPTELSQKEDQRHLARLIGELPVPSTGRIGTAKGMFHLAAQAQRVDLKPLRQIGLQRFGNSNDRRGRICCQRDNGRRQGRLRTRGKMGHRETPE